MIRKKTIRKVEKGFIREMTPIFIIIGIVLAIFLLKPSITGLSVAENITSENQIPENIILDNLTVESPTFETPADILLNETVDKTTSEEPASNIAADNTAAESTNETIVTTDEPLVDNFGSDGFTPGTILDYDKGKTKDKIKHSTRLLIQDSNRGRVDSFISVKDKHRIIQETTGIAYFDIDEGVYDVDVTINNKHVKRIEFRDVAFNGNVSEFVKVDDFDDERFIQSYAIDPTAVNFTEATVTVTASPTATELYKCLSWNFENQSCEPVLECAGFDVNGRQICQNTGGWKKYLDLIPGQDYTFILTPEDPGFAEYNSSLGSPQCSTSESPCIADSSLLVCGGNQASPGPEPNQPNTIDSCSDSDTLGTCHSDESVENLTILDLNSSNFRVGDTIEVNYTLYCWGNADRIALYYTNSTDSVGWRRITSGNPVCAGAGFEEFSEQFELDSNTDFHAVRAIIQYNSDIASDCDGAIYTDYDDVSFLVDSANLPPTTPTTITCDSGSCNNTFYNNVDVQCSGSTDPDADTITYYIDATLRGQNEVENTDDKNFIRAGGIPVVQTYTSNTAVPGSSLTLTKPTGVVVGDLLLLILGNDDNTNTAQWSTLTGWTLINEAGSATPDAHSAAYRRIADGTEGTTIAVPAQSSDDYWGYYVRVTGVDAANPINVIGADFNGGNSLTHAISGVTTAVANTLAFYVSSFDGADGDPFGVTGTGWSKTAEIEAGTTGNNAGGSWGTKQQPTAGATGTATVTSTVSDGSSGFQFAVAGISTLSDVNTTTATYPDFAYNYTFIDNITITVEVDSFDPRASVAQATADPDLYLEMYNGAAWISIGAFNLPLIYTGTGVDTTNRNLSLTTSDPTTLAAWENSHNQDFRITGFNFDKTATVSDEINYTNVWAIFDGKGWVEIGNHVQSSAYAWDFSSLAPLSDINLRCRAVDLSGSNTYSSNYVAGCNVTLSGADVAAPIVTLLNPPDSSQDSNGYVLFEYVVSDASSINSCKLVINNIVDQTDTSITKGVTQQFTKSNLGEATYNWYINCTDASANEGNSAARTLTVDLPDDYTGDPIIVNETILDSSGTPINANIEFIDTGSGQTDYSALSGNNESISSGTFNIRITPFNHVIQEITFIGVNISGNVTDIVDLEDSAESENFAEIYAFNPLLAFVYEYINITVTATTSDLFKCPNWNFATDTCTDGRWKKVKDITPGQNYTYTLGANDPGFGEGSNLINVLDREDYLLNNTQTNLTTGEIVNVEINITQDDFNTTQSITVYAFNSSAINNDLNVQEPSNDSVYITNFAVDMSNLNATSANITINSTGKHLFKCTNFSFIDQICLDDDDYEQAATNLVSGQTYVIELTAIDPGFGITIEGTLNTSDAYLRSGQANNNFGGNTNIRVGRRTAGNIFRGILWFNTSYIPEGAVIDSANLSLYFDSIPSGDNTGLRTHGAHRVNESRDWTELEVTWNNFNSTDTWTVPGGDYEAVPTAIVAFDSTNLSSRLSYNVTADVQDFVNNSSTNRGWIIKDQSETSNLYRVDYASTENSNQANIPRLIISYTYFDTTLPTISSVTDTPDPVILTKDINITATVTDNVAVENVTVEINNTNYSMELVNSDIWEYVYDTSDLNTGTYNYTIYANDTSGNNASNSSGQFTVKIPELTDPLRSGNSFLLYVPPLNPTYEPILVVTAFNDNTYLYIEDQNEDGDSDDSVGDMNNKFTLDRGQSKVVFISDGADDDEDDGDYFFIDATDTITASILTKSEWIAYTIAAEGKTLSGEEYYIYARDDASPNNSPLDVVIFAYADDTHIRLSDITGAIANEDGIDGNSFTIVNASLDNVIIDTFLDMGDHISYIGDPNLLQQGHTYRVSANKKVGIVAGALTADNSGRDGGYYVGSVDGLTAGTEFYAYVGIGRLDDDGIPEDELYFFNTETNDVVVEAIYPNGTINETYHFQLNASNNYFYNLSFTGSQPYKHITSSNPMSILAATWLEAGTGDIGDFAPAVTGAGVGKLFNMYIPPPANSGFTHTIVFAYYNQTFIEIYNTSDGFYFGNTTLDEKQHWDFSLTYDTQLTVNSTQNVGVQVSNYDDNIAFTAVSIPYREIDVVKESDIDEVDIGDNVTYTINVSNFNEVALFNVEVKDILENGLQYLNSTQSNGLPAPVVYNDAPADNQTTLSWNISQLNSGKTMEFTVTATVVTPDLIHKQRVDASGIDADGNPVKGNDVSLVFLIDTTPPNIQDVTDSPDPQVVQALTTINVTATDLWFVSIVIAEINGTNYTMSTTDNQNFYVQFNGTSAATYPYTIYAIDSSGNEQVSTGHSITFGQGLTVALVNPADYVVNDTDALVNFTFECAAISGVSALANMSLYITDSNNQNLALYATEFVSGSSNSSNWTLELGTGNYTWNCVARDVVGGTDWGDMERTVIINFSAPYVDTQEPEIELFNPLDNMINQTETIYFEVCTDENSTITALVFWDYTSELVTLLYNGTDYCYEYAWTNTSYVDTYDVLFNATDPSGNSNTTLGNFTVNDISAPSVTNIIPSGTAFNQNTVVNVSANVTDLYWDNVETVFANITDPDGVSTLVLLYEIDNTQIFNSTYSSTNLVGQYSVQIIANDTFGNVNNSEIAYFTISDGQMPFAEQPGPTPGTIINQTNTILLSLNATDNVAVDVVLANITWDATSDIVELTYNAGTEFYELTWTNTSYVDTYNVQYIVNDTSGLINDTTTTNFIVNDISAPSVTDLQPQNGAQFNYTDIITVTANVTDFYWDNVETVLANITDPNGVSTIIPLSEIADTQIFNSTYSSTTLIGQYTLHIIANDTSGNINNTEITFFVVNDNVPPQSLQPKPTPGEIINQTNSILISLNATDNDVIDTVLANLTWDSTMEQVQLTYNSGTGLYEYTWTNTTYLDQYNVLFIVNDTSGLVNNTETTYFIVNDITAVTVTDLQPQNGAQFNYTDLVTVTANVTDFYWDNVETVLANITDPNGVSTIIPLSEIADTQIFNSTYSSTTLIGQYTLQIIANDTSGNLNNTEITFFVVNDNVFPDVNSLQPSPGGIYNQTNSVPLVLNATDNDAIDTVLANLTWDSTSELIELTFNPGTGLYEYPWTNTSYLDQYNITYIVNDSSGNTVTNDTYFIVNDIAAVTVTDLQPQNGAQFNYTDLVTVTANVTDFYWDNVETVLANITDPNGVSTIIPLSEIADTQIFNSTYSSTTLIGQYTLHIIANDTSGNINNTEITFFVINDNVFPDVNSLQPFSGEVYNQTNSVPLVLNATDNDAIDTVLANLTWDSTSEQVELTFNPGTGLYEYPWTNTSYVDRYNITYIVNDSSGNVVTNNTYFIVNDISEPQVNEIVSATFNQTNSVLVYANVTDLYWENTDSVTALVQWDSASETIPLTYNGATGLYEYTWTNTSYVDQYNVTIAANDTSGNINNTQSGSFMVQDVSPPSVLQVQPAPGTNYDQFQSILISANVSDLYWENTDSVTALVQWDSTSETIPLTFNPGTGLYEYTWTNTTYVDQYNITIIANDTYGNVNNTETTNFIINDISEPVHSDISEFPTDSPVYSPAGFYEFNITWTDNAAVEDVVFEWNGVNYTYSNAQITKTGDIYSITFNDLAAGIYNYAWYANDSAGNENFTGPLDYTITKASSEVNLLLNGTDANYNVLTDELANITGFIVNPAQGYIELYANGTLINSGADYLENITSYALSGQYNITVIYYETENYSSSFEMHYLFVGIPDTPPEITLNHPVNNLLTNSQNINFNCSALDDQKIENISFYWDYQQAFGFSEKQDFGTQNATAIFTRTGLQSGNITWNCQTYDNSTAKIDDWGDINYTVTVDIDEPGYSSMTEEPIDPATYLAGQSYRFNITVVDNVDIGTVTLEFNEINYTATDLGQLFTVTLPDLPTGNYNYIWYMNDTAGNNNQTSVQTYTINPITSTCSLDFLPASGSDYTLQGINASCTCTSTEAVDKLYRDGQDVTSENNQYTQLAAGTYNYVCNVSTTLNYTQASNSSAYTINKAQSFVNLTLNDIDNNITISVNDLVDFNGTLVQGEGDLVLLEDTLLINQGATPLHNTTSYPDTGEHNITVTHPETENYTFSKDTHFVTVQDTREPAWSNNMSWPEPATYSPGASYQFNVTWTDETTIDTVIIEQNFNGLFQNFTVPNIGSVYYYNYGDFAAGSYTWRMYANDTSGNTNVTDTFIYTVQKANTTTSLTLNGAANNLSVTYPSTVTASYSTSALSAIMYRDGSDVSSENNAAQTLGAGTYNYTVINPGNDNYTGSEITYFAAVLPATPSCTLTFNPLSPQTYPVTVTASCSCTNTETTAKFERDNVDVTSENNAATALGAGTFLYNCSSSQTQNYTSAENIKTYIVNKALSSIDLKLDSGDSSLIVEVWSIVNHTASLLNPASGNIAIYVNNSQESSGTSPLTLFHNYTTLGTYNSTALYTATENYSDAYETHYVTVIDTIPPVIETVTVQPHSAMVKLGERFNLSITSSDNYQIDTEKIIIILPDGSTTETTLPMNYVTPQYGLYNYTIIINDTSGNTATRSGHFVAGSAAITQQYNLVNETGGIAGSVNIYYSDGFAILHHHLLPQGILVDPHILDYLYDYEYLPDYGVAEIIVRNINISIDDNESLGYYEVIPPSKTNFIATIGLNTTYLSADRYSVTFRYNHTNYTDQSKLRLFKCANWDFQTRTCTDDSWVEIAAVHDLANTLFTFDVTGFSAFSIGEPVAQPAAPGGGGGGCAPSWQCGDWKPSYCPSSGIRTRQCLDANYCGTVEGKPVETKSCIYVPYVEIPPLFEFMPTYDYTLNKDVTVMVVDRNNNLVPFADIEIISPSGIKSSLTANDQAQLTFVADETGTWRIDLSKQGWIGTYFEINVVASEEIPPEQEPVKIELPKPNYLWCWLILLFILLFLLGHRFVTLETITRKGPEHKEIDILIKNISKHWKRTAKDIRLYIRTDKPRQLADLKVLNYTNVSARVITKSRCIIYIFKHHREEFFLKAQEGLLLRLNTYPGSPYPAIKLEARYRWKFLPVFVKVAVKIPSLLDKIFKNNKKLMEAIKEDMHQATLQHRRQYALAHKHTEEAHRRHRILLRRKSTIRWNIFKDRLSMIVSALVGFFNKQTRLSRQKLEERRIRLLNEKQAFARKQAAAVEEYNKLQTIKKRLSTRRMNLFNRSVTRFFRRIARYFTRTEHSFETGMHTFANKQKILARHSVEALALIEQRVHAAHLKAKREQKALEQRINMERALQKRKATLKRRQILRELERRRARKYQENRRFEQELAEIRKNLKLSRTLQKQSFSRKRNAFIEGLRYLFKKLGKKERKTVAGLHHAAIKLHRDIVRDIHVIETRIKQQQSLNKRRATLQHNKYLEQLKSERAKKLREKRDFEKELAVIRDNLKKSRTSEKSGWTRSRHEFIDSIEDSAHTFQKKNRKAITSFDEALDDFIREAKKVPKKFMNLFIKKKRVITKYPHPKLTDKDVEIIKHQIKRDIMMQIIGLKKLGKSYSDILNNLIKQGYPDMLVRKALDFIYHVEEKKDTVLSKNDILFDIKKR